MTTRAVYLEDDDTHALKEAVGYLRTLHSIEREHQLNDDEELWHLLGGVDPVHLDQVATHLEGMRALFARSRIAVDPPPRDRP